VTISAPLRAPALPGEATPEVGVLRTTLPANSLW